MTAGAVVAAGLLGGCTSWTPRHAEILVVTAPPGAACALSRGGQQLAITAPTPAIALVDPAMTDGIAVSCRRYAFEDASVTLPPRPASLYEQRIDIAMTPRPPGVAR